MPIESPRTYTRFVPPIPLLAIVAAALIALVLLFLGARVARAYDLDESKCLSCHSDPTLVRTDSQGVSISLYVDAAELGASAHRYLDCTTCHSTTPHQTSSPLTKLSLARRCGTCHEYELKLHLTSIHGQQLLQGNQDVATCADCHSDNSTPHSVVRVLESTASTFRRNIAQTCAKCHNDPQLMGKYGIVERVYESYMRSFHGKAIQLSSEVVGVQALDKATCTNCHGTHDIKAVDDPTAPVAGMANLAETCEQCHPGAGVNFAKGFLGHREADTDRLPVVYWGERFFFFFTRIVLAMGALLVAVEIGRWAVGRIAGEGKDAPKE